MRIVFGPGGFVEIFFNALCDFTKTLQLTGTEEMSGSDSFSPSREMPMTDSGTVTPSLPILAPQYPVGNCTFYYEYLLANPIAGNIVESISGKLMRNLPCNTTNIWLGATVGPIQITALLPALQQMVDLQSLRINGAPIGNAEVSALAPVIMHLLQLQKLEFQDTLVGDVGVDALVPILPLLANLYRLSFYRATNVTDAGALALLPALKQLPKLTVLLFNYLNLNATVRTALTNALPTVSISF